MPEAYTLQRIAAQAGLGVLGSLVAVLSADVVTRRDMAVGLISGVVLAMLAPAAIMDILQIDSWWFHLLMSFFCGVSGKSLCIQFARNPLDMVERLRRLL